MDNNKAEKVIGELKKDFKVVGSHHIHGWYAWAAGGLMIGVLIAVAYVSNNAFKFSPSRADEPGLVGSPDSWPIGHDVNISETWSLQDPNQLPEGVIEPSDSWPVGHEPELSSGGTVSGITGWPPGHFATMSLTWPVKHIE